MKVIIRDGAIIGILPKNVFDRSFVFKSNNGSIRKKPIFEMLESIEVKYPAEDFKSSIKNCFRDLNEYLYNKSEKQLDWTFEIFLKEINNLIKLNKIKKTFQLKVHIHSSYTSTYTKDANLEEYRIHILILVE